MLRKAFAIRDILLAAFLLAGLVPAALMTWMAFSAARGALEEEIARDMRVRASATAAEIDRMMFERLQNVASWSRLEIMQELRVGDVDKRLSRFLSETRNTYSGVYVELNAVDKHGLVVASSDPHRIGQHYEPANGGQGIPLLPGDVHAARLVGDRLPLSARIPDEVGNEAGTLYAVFDWSQVRQILAAATANGSSAALFDRHGKRLAATENWHGRDASQDIAGTATAKGFEDFPGFGWEVTMVQPTDTALAPVRKMGETFSLLLLFIAAIAALTAMPIASSIAHPLGRLSYFARNFVREQRTAPPPSGGPAEVRELSAAFAQMISDLDRLKENLTRAAKLAVVGEMAAAMSHEVRTPLGILRSSAQLLLREPGLSEEGREVCGFIISETERMNKLVNTLLDCARSRPLELKPVNLAELAGQAIAMLKPQAAKKGITLELDPATPDAIALLDTEQITQVLLNLLLNALQILPEGGHIAVSVRREERTLILEVGDDGPGISPELRERVFDPFFTQRNGGIGLGLTVVRQIVAAHHGDIVADRSAFGGALFRVRLPSGT
jgi:signal transduction histidine kinase